MILDSSFANSSNCDGRLPKVIGFFVRIGWNGDFCCLVLIFVERHVFSFCGKYLMWFGSYFRFAESICVGFDRFSLPRCVSSSRFFPSWDSISGSSTRIFIPRTVFPEVPLVFSVLEQYSRMFFSNFYSSDNAHFPPTTPAHKKSTHSIMKRALSYKITILLA